ncbi:MAG: tetratricopeptide repeat protein [Ekhidna sp.]|uniref:sensor histidine kinase n=1 Tax=Ekhidna sp. TaxID=2608089 RepID=UPI0032EF9C11
MKSTLSLVLFLSMVTSTIAQNKVDSLRSALESASGANEKVKTLILIADQYQNPNDKLVYVREAYALSPEASDENKIRAANKMGVCHGMLGQIDSSKFYFNKALEASLISQDSVFISSAYNGLGNLSRISGDLDGALANFLNALNYSDAVPNRQWEADILTNISGVHFDLKNYETALEKVFEARDIYESLNDEKNISYTANLLAIVYRALGELDKAFLYNQEALQMLLEIRDTTQIIYNYVNTTEILIQQNQFDKAAEHALKTIKLADQFGERDPHITSLLTLSSIYYRQGKITLAKKYAEEGITMAKRFEFNGQLPNAYMLQSLIESAMGNYLDAYKWTELRQAANDSIRSREIADKISELNVQYETKEKENEIARLNAEQEVKSLELEQAQTRNFFLSTLAILTIIVGAVIFYLYRQRMKINRQLKAVNHTKDRLFSMIAHDIKNPLSAFKSIAQALDENYKSMSEDQLNLFISQLDTSSSKLLDLLQNLLEWSITESGSLRFHPEKVKLKEVANEAIELFKGASDAKQLTIENKIDESEEVTADYKMLFSIIRNLISNSVKFTRVNGRISIESKPNGQLIEIVVADDGQGMTPEQVTNLFDKNSVTDKDGTGLGLVLCKEFVEKNGGNIWVESEKGSGTTFKFTLKRAA